MRHVRLNALFCCLVATTALTATVPAQAHRPLIQVALLLDTSNSMDGLIGQAKSQLWTFVNHFAPLRRNGQSPELQVALYEYGKSSIPAGEAFMRQVVPFTTDLDRVSDQLFALTTNGGEEFCGTVIRNAVQGLGWSSSDQDLKVIFIAGNEPFTQGSVNYRQSCALAKSRNVLVNTIFCGSYQEGDLTNWADGARLGGGSYMAIDQNQQEVHIPAPQDEEIEKLGTELNKTYIPIGEAGKLGAENQARQDANAAKVGKGSTNQRVLAKSSSFYRAESWDLVDAEKSGKRKLESIDKKDLPKELQAMKPAEARAYVDAKAKERTELQARIQRLNSEREKFIAAKRQELAAKGGAKTLDAAMVDALALQAKAKGFSSN
jgi:hypothetical protein